MKTFLKYSGFLAAAIAVVGFILMMATPAFAYFPKNGDPQYLTGTQAIFGEEVKGSISIITINAGHINAVWSATLAWILAMVGVIALLLGVILPLLKLNKFAGLINIIALCSLVIAGIFVFISQPCTFTLNGASEPSNAFSDYGLNATWIIVAILYIAAGVLAALPAAVDFLGGKKKK
ncbi:MAG: hypothetical protein IKI55_01365 [Bacilli bacterium]|nr:hypothetical protein [Bacilli bacterium]MBR6866180.1 hypothetical protein [Bacilli bacterium]